MDSDGRHDPSKDYTARGLSSEAIQLLRSHEKMDELQFKQMREQQEEIKVLISTVKEDLSHELSGVRREMREGFKAYDNKFWSLAVVTISLLLTITGMLMYKILFPH